MQWWSLIFCHSTFPNRNNTAYNFNEKSWWLNLSSYIMSHLWCFSNSSVSWTLAGCFLLVIFKYVVLVSFFRVGMHLRMQMLSNNLLPHISMKEPPPTSTLTSLPWSTTPSQSSSRALKLQKVQKCLYIWKLIHLIMIVLNAFSLLFFFREKCPSQHVLLQWVCWLRLPENQRYWVCKVSFCIDG